MAESAPTLKQVQAEALGLDPAERSELIRALMESLVPASEDPVAAVWLEEADRRWKQMEREADEGVPADGLIGGIRARLRE